jgi:hypothetical protein
MEFFARVAVEAPKAVSRKERKEEEEVWRLPPETRGPWECIVAHCVRVGGGAFKFSNENTTWYLSVIRALPSRQANVQAAILLFWSLALRIRSDSLDWLFREYLVQVLCCPDTVETLSRANRNAEEAVRVSEETLPFYVLRSAMAVEWWEGEQMVEVNLLLMAQIAAHKLGTLLLDGGLFDDHHSMIVRRYRVSELVSYVRTQNDAVGGLVSSFLERRDVRMRIKCY